MPRGDGTGPLGKGPMTGRTSRYCSGYGLPGYDNPFSRQGFGTGFDRGRGFWDGWGCGRRFMNRGARFFGWLPYGEDTIPPGMTPTLGAKKRFLEGQAEVLQGQLDEIRKKLDGLASQ